MIGEYIFNNAFSLKPIVRERFEYGASTQSCNVFANLRPVTKNDVTVILRGKVTKNFSKDTTQPPIPTESQEEYLIERYLEVGIEFSEDLDGIFLIIVLDSRTNCVSIHNNRYTCHGIYYYQDSERLIFSDKITSIIEFFLDSPQPHMGAVRSFLSNGFTSADQTQIQGIKKLLPAFTCNISSKGAQLANYWDKEISFKRSSGQSIEKSIDEYIEIYRQGIKNYLDVHKPEKVATLLSGGNDTSFVLANLSEVTDKKIHAYTATFPGWAWNEESFAKNISEKFGANFHPIPFEAKDIDEVSDLIAANEEPVVGSSLPLHIIGRKAKEDGFRVMFGGDGGDTLWGEYYPVAEYHRYIKNLPKSLRALAHKTSKALRKLTDWERFWELEHVSQLFVEDNYYEDFMRKLCTYRHFSDDYQKKLLKDEVYKNPIPKSIKEIEFTKENFRDALIEGKLYNAFYTYQSFHTYNCMEHSGLNLYFPTIQKDVISFITNLPYHWVNGGTSLHRLMNHKSINRRLHKKALARFLRQDEIYNRSFDIPWYNILRPRAEVLELLKQRLKARGWFEESVLDKLFETFKAQKVKEYELLELKHHGYRIFTLLSLEIWCIYVLDKGFMDEGFSNRALEDILAN
ncbi:MAG: hypothetical protein CME67_00210 [Halobacteriovoraceae bacterium]|nr:hypothetical protein [Halobacteriovoraceae bacterium]